MPPKKYDLDLMISITRGNDELLRKLIQLFLRNTPGILKKMKLAYTAKDLPHFTTLINELKPSFGYFRIRNIEADLGKAEKLAYINMNSTELFKLIKCITTDAEGILSEMEHDFNQHETITGDSTVPGTSIFAHETSAINSI